jgi:hypothetical protein
MEFIEAQIPVVLHDAVHKFEPGYAAAGEKYKYPKDDVEDAENKYDPRCQN